MYFVYLYVEYEIPTQKVHGVQTEEYSFHECVCVLFCSHVQEEREKKNKKEFCNLLSKLYTLCILQDES